MNSRENPHNRYIQQIVKKLSQYKRVSSTFSLKTAATSVGILYLSPSDVWDIVDRMKEKYPDLTPYRFKVANRELSLVDSVYFSNNSMPHMFKNKEGDSITVTKAVPLLRTSSRTDDCTEHSHKSIKHRIYY